MELKKREKNPSGLVIFGEAVAGGAVGVWGVIAGLEFCAGRWAGVGVGGDGGSGGVGSVD